MRHVEIVCKMGKGKDLPSLSTHQMSDGACKGHSTGMSFLGLCSLHWVGTSNCNVNFQYLSSSVFPYVEEDLYSWMVRLSIKSILCFLSKFEVLSEELTQILLFFNNLYYSYILKLLYLLFLSCSISIKLILLLNISLSLK